MAKTAVINVRIDPELKLMAEELYKSFGISLSDAINIFINKSIMDGGLPFELKQPRFNMETEFAIAEADAIIERIKPAKSYSSARELFAELDAED